MCVSPFLQSGRFGGRARKKLTWELLLVSWKVKGGQSCVKIFCFLLKCTLATRNIAICFLTVPSWLFARMFRRSHVPGKTDLSTESEIFTLRGWGTTQFHVSNQPPTAHFRQKLPHKASVEPEGRRMERPAFERALEPDGRPMNGYRVRTPWLRGRPNPKNSPSPLATCGCDS